MDFDNQQAFDDYFDQWGATYDRQAGRFGETTVDCVLAGHTIRLRFAGDGLQFLADPLSHLISRDSQSNLSGPGCDRDPFEILIFHRAGSTDEIPLPPWNIEVTGAGNPDSWRREQGNTFVNHVPSIGFLQLWNRRKRQAIYWIDRIERLSFWEVAAPFRTIFRWWAEEHGFQLAHAAVVGRDGSGVLLAGRSGQGKSTTAATCLDAGLDYVSDDYVLVSRQTHPTAYCLYNSAKLHSHLLQSHFPHWQHRVVRHIGPESKSLFFVHRSCPDQLKDHLRLAAVVCPRLTDREESRCVANSRAEAMRAVGPSTVLPHASCRSSGFSFLANLIRQLPSYRLELGPIPTSPQAIVGLLRRQAARAV